MIEWTMVKPATETPKETIWLTDVDLIRLPLLSHSPVYYIYPNSNNNPITQVNSTLLKSTLSQFLVTFYPIAGRLSKNDVTGRIEIDCNAKGVLFVDVETSYNVSDFGEFTPNHMIRKLLVPVCDYSGGLTNIPLLMVQLTRFACGGVALGLAAHHYVGDGAADVYLTSASQQIEETKVEGLFKFSQDHITALKQQAMPTSEDKHRYSTFNVLAAHVWRCALKARDIKLDTLVKFSTTVNGRSKFKQGDVPKGYYGNYVFNTTYFDKCGEILSKPLGYIASKVHEAVTRVDEEYIQSALDYLSLQRDVTAIANGPHFSRCPDIHVNYLKGIPFYEMDFGWGKPGIFRHGGLGYEGHTFIMPSEDGQYLLLAITLFTSHMERFEKIIYDF
ncbi:shikimate O-hydroxycinnamoyltransferase-like [Silene latifolia]|uniref:shikimate O-hydroxycinnamoyltransferase-like n=1 Tax=Silene latifolia TaxID=37657 RepID=UPI003D76F9A4